MHRDKRVRSPRKKVGGNKGSRVKASSMFSLPKLCPHTDALPL